METLSRIRRIGLAVLAWSAHLCTAQAASLVWNRAPEPEVIGYHVYIGEESETYTFVEDVGNVGAFNLDSLSPGSTYFFAVTAYGANGAESEFSKEVSFTPGRPNHPPVANADTYSIAKNAGIYTDNQNGLLANDSDPDGDALAVVLVTGPSNGDLQLMGAGWFSYQPSMNFTGTDSFSYRVTDGKATSEVALVTIVVTNATRPNAAPIAANDQFATTRNQALTITTSGVLANDSDPDGDSVTAVLDSLPSNGQLVLNSDGSFTYRPATNFVGSDSFKYRAYDGVNASSTATVTISVSNRVPLAAGDTFTTAKDKLLSVTASTGVMLNDIDADGDVLTCLLVSSTTHGQLTLGATGGFLYRPVTNFVGSDSFSYRVSDGVATSIVATVTLVVTNSPIVNHAPIPTDDQYATAINLPLIVSADSGVLRNDADADQNPLTAIIVSGTTNGQLTFGASGGFTYEPATNFVGMDGFSYRIHDGFETSAIASVTISVTNRVQQTNSLPSNRSPIAVADYFSTARNGLLSITASTGVLANDADPDGDALVPAILALPGHGALTMYNDGAFLYMPAADFVGTDTFQYRASDGKLVSSPVTVFISITNPVGGLNRDPIAVADSYLIRQGSVLVVGPAQGLLANDVDPERSSLGASLLSPPTNGQITVNLDGSFSYTPNVDFIGDEVLQYRAWDGTNFSAPSTVTISVVPLDTVTCEDCLAELEYFATARTAGAAAVAAIPPQAKKPVTIPEALAEYNFVLQKLGRKTTDSDRDNLLSVANCLFAVVSNVVSTKTETVTKMYPSPWSANAAKVLETLRKPLESVETPRDAAKLIGIAARMLARLDGYIARGALVPSSLEGRTVQFDVRAPASDFTITFAANNGFTLQAGEALKTGTYRFVQTAWDKGTLTLTSPSAPPVVYQLQFRSGRGRVASTSANGTFVLLN